jgi:hypothetical protein
MGYAVAMVMQIEVIHKNMREKSTEHLELLLARGGLYRNGQKGRQRGLYMRSKE